MNARVPVLVALAGRPGTGKTTVGKALAMATGALYLRVDTVEHAMGPPCGAAGYAVIQAVAAENLSLGHDVVCDSVNPVAASRAGFAAAALRGGARLIDVEVLCSNDAEHRRRVEARVPDIAGFALPDWGRVETMAYEPWTAPRIVLDTARRDVGQAVALLMKQMDLAAPAW